MDTIQISWKYPCAIDIIRNSWKYPRPVDIIRILWILSILITLRATYLVMSVLYFTFTHLVKVTGTTWDTPIFRAAYFATLGDDLIFVEPTHFVQPLPENNTLLDDHNGFALKRNKIVKNYQENCTDPKTQQMMFLHITNHVTTENCVADKKKNVRFVDLEPSAGLDVAMIEIQTSVLNPTEQDMVISNLIIQSQGERYKKN